MRRRAGCNRLIGWPIAEWGERLKRLERERREAYLLVAVNGVPSEPEVNLLWMD